MILFRFIKHERSKVKSPYNIYMVKNGKEWLRIVILTQIIYNYTKILSP